LISKSEYEGLEGSFRTVGNVVRYLPVLTSTMDIAWELAVNGAPDGTFIVTDHQTAGRGRHARCWVSEVGEDILCSVVLRPRVALAGELLMIAALAVVDVAESLGVAVGIKWPNDVQVSGKKLAGVIAESVTEPSRSGKHDISERLTAVIGIGLNVNFDPDEHADVVPESTSLGKELQRPVNRFDVLLELMRSLDDYYSQITSGGSVVTPWRNKLTTLGKDVTVSSEEPGMGSLLRGLAHDVDSFGRLILRDEFGREWPVAAGEVTVREVSF
jgi:BirA family biotin operon repressor/biotin-[acetyl-CoA-carboxylase] ligase